MLAIIHYDEIAIKGKNKPFFEKKLVDNIRSFLKKENYNAIKRVYGRIILDYRGTKEHIQETLKTIAGISHFSFAEQVALTNNIEEIKQKTLEIAQEKEKHSAKTFHIKTIRSNKSFPLDSIKINELVGEHIIKNTKLAVSLKDSDFVIFIEIKDNNAYVYTEKIKSLSGLPVGVTGKLIALISGGIDSPVAAYKMFLRGCSISIVHFHNYNINTKAVKEKILSLAKILSKYQFKTKLYLVPFKELQQEIITKIPAKYRMIVYRRFMFRIAELILKKEHAKAFVTGDNLAQVASQTMENLEVIYASTNIPIFSPLIGENKQDIINLAKQINTYETSILPYDDCCTYFVAEHPETKSNLADIEKLESALDIKKLVEDAFNKTEMRGILR